MLTPPGPVIPEPDALVRVLAGETSGDPGSLLGEAHPLPPAPPMTLLSKLSSVPPAPGKGDDPVHE